MTITRTAALAVAALAAIAVAARTSGKESTAEMAPDLAAQVEQLRHEVAALRAQIAATPNVQALEHRAIPDAVQLCGSPVAVDRPEIKEALAYELVLTVGKPTMPLLWMRRAPVMLPSIEAKLRDRGLPDDLKYVAMVESDLRWIPESPAGAVGLWQFVARTGKTYGLRVDRWLDERMDPERSTDAALAYLASLHREYGDWFLALAAYNAGEALVDHAIRDQGTRNYFDLYLPYETRRYVFRVLAAKLVYERPEDFGLFRMTPFFSPGYRQVEVTGGDLRQIAHREATTYAALRAHNPQVKGASLPPGRFRLRIPTANGPTATAGSRTGAAAQP